MNIFLLILTIFSGIFIYCLTRDDFDWYLLFGESLKKHDQEELEKVRNKENEDIEKHTEQYITLDEIKKICNEKYPLYDFIYFFDYDFNGLIIEYVKDKTLYYIKLQGNFFTSYDGTLNLEISRKLFNNKILAFNNIKE